MIISSFVIDKNLIEHEMKILNDILAEQKQLKKTLLFHLEKISDAIPNAVDPEDSTSLISCLDGIKKSFENLKNNIRSLYELKDYLSNISTVKTLDISYIQKYNENFEKLFTKISEDNIFYYSFMESILKHMKVYFPGSDNFNTCISPKIEETTATITTQEDLPYEKAPEHKEPEPVVVEEPVIELVENTLIVDEKKQIAILPYSIIELEKYFSKNPEKYSSLQDIINKEYTITTRQYKSLAFARFKEAFNFAKNKCEYSFMDALSLANELFFNSNLDPTIISACKNIDELDIYLSCLEDNTLDEFKCFEILYK